MMEMGTKWNWSHVCHYLIFCKRTTTRRTTTKRTTTTWRTTTTRRTTTTFAPKSKGTTIFSTTAKPTTKRIRTTTIFPKSTKAKVTNFTEEFIQDTSSVYDGNQLWSSNPSKIKPKRTPLYEDGPPQWK